MRELTQQEIDRAPKGATHYRIGSNDAPVWYANRIPANSDPIPR